MSAQDWRGQVVAETAEQEAVQDYAWFALRGSWRDLARAAADCRAVGLPLSDALFTQAVAQAVLSDLAPIHALRVALSRMEQVGLRDGPVAGLTEREARARSMWAGMEMVGHIAEALAVTEAEVESIIADLYARGLLLAP
jgi:hypothetical protein